MAIGDNTPEVLAHEQKLRDNVAFARRTLDKMETEKLIDHLIMCRAHIAYMNERNRPAFNDAQYYQYLGTVEILRERGVRTVRVISGVINKDESLITL